MPQHVLDPGHTGEELHLEHIASCSLRDNVECFQEPAWCLGDSDLFVWYLFRVPWVNLVFLACLVQTVLR